MSDNGPIEIKDEETLAFCKCGLSNHWPFCDASHHTFGNTGPEIIELDKTKTYYLCGCHKTKTPPFCDGSHLPK